MRQITTHAINELNEALKLTAVDEPGNGGASHRYEIELVGGSPNFKQIFRSWSIDFQEGALNVANPNGLSGEVLLAILIDRLQGFQSGPYACKENAVALTHLETALMWLQKRTRERVLRGVEGTHKV